MNGIELVAFADQPVMPWANGGGSTRQIAIDPPGSSLATGCRWRVSRAQVASDGPFSILPGIDRSLWLLSGAGMRLDVAGRVVELTRPLQRLDFAGETAIAATLLAGPCEDLNVMVDRERVQADALIVHFPAGGPLVLAAAPHWLVVVLSGELALANGGPVACTGDAVRGSDSGFAATARAATTALVCTFVPRVVGA
jgi:uncharacterized protein